MYEAWASVSVKSMLPQLGAVQNPDGSYDTSTMMGKAKQSILDQKLEMQEQLQRLAFVVGRADQAVTVTTQALTAIDTVLAQISETGLHATTITAEGLTGFMGEIYASLTNPNDPTRPVVTESTPVGAIVMLVTGTSLAEVGLSLAGIRKVYQGWLPQGPAPEGPEGSGS